MNYLTKQQIRKYKINRASLFKGSTNSMYVHEDILIPIIMQSRLSDPKTIKFRSDLGFNPINLILKKAISSNTIIKSIFCRKNKVAAQNKALENERLRADMYFSEHKFAVEIGEKGHTDRNQNRESKRQAKIENHSDRKFFHRINPDGESFDIFLEVSKIKDYITQWNEGKIKEQENKIKEEKKKFAK